MNDHFSSDIGRVAIEAYLDSIDEALIAAHAPRSDRLQVLQDLESQIADMLAQQPQPLTEEAVKGVILALEPPSHFAATYGNGKRPMPSAVRLKPRFSELRWPVVSAVSASLLPGVCLLFLIAVASDANGAVVGLPLMVMFFAGFLFTPFALWIARKQLLADGKISQDRSLFVKAIVTYGVFAPAILVIVAAAVTGGAVLIPLGIVAFIYLQYAIVRRACRHMTSGIPQSPPPSSVPNGNGIQSAFVPAGP